MSPANNDQIYVYLGIRLEAVFASKCIEVNRYNLIDNLIDQIGMLHQLENSQGINTDLKIISTYLDNPMEPKIQPRNLSELSDIIKNRLVNRKKQPEQNTICREWLKDKGMNIQALLEYLNYKSSK